MPDNVSATTQLLSIDWQKYNELITEIDSLRLSDRLSKLTEEVKPYQQQTLAPDFWNNPENAKTVNSKISAINKEVAQVEEIIKLTADLKFIASEIESLGEEYIHEYLDTLDKLEKLLEAYRLQKFLSGKLDSCNAVLSIFAGQGGTEAHDWTEILLRMYLRYFEKSGWQAEIIEKTMGTEAGISSVSVKVSGEYVYGHLKVEHGTHRLVRVSPFNAQGLRQTSFAGVEVVPIIENAEEIEIKPEEIEFNAVRSGGAGGQNVNKVATSVRIRHIPTGILVSASSERSQLQNRELAMELLRGKLALLEAEKRQNLISAEGGKSFTASWGNQIRNYVLHPYQLVKDVRTRVETTQVDSVLNGDLDEFVNAGIKYLATDN